MIEQLTEEQKQWVRSNWERYSPRRLAEEFEKCWAGSLESAAAECSEWFEGSYFDGIWLIEEAGL